MGPKTTKNYGNHKNKVKAPCKHKWYLISYCNTLKCKRCSEITRMYCKNAKFDTEVNTGDDVISTGETIRKVKK